MATIPEAMKIAVRHHQAGQLQPAEQIYRQVLQADPNQADALHLLGVIAHQVGQNQDAVDYIGRAIASNPNNASFHANLGDVYRALRQLGEAVAAYRRALQIKPDYAEAQNNLGIALQEQGKLEEAVASYRRALQINPRNAQAHVNLGNVCLMNGQPDQAVAAYRQALQIQPDFAMAHNNLGNAIMEQGELDQAVSAYRRAVEIDPAYVDAHNNLGNALKDLNKLDEAVAAYRRALQLKPDVPDVHNNLGNALKDREELDKAVTAYRRAIQLKPDYADAHNNLGKTLEELGDHRQAAASYGRALQIMPERIGPERIGPERIGPERSMWQLRIAALCPTVFQSNRQIDEYRRNLSDELQRFSLIDLRLKLTEIAISATEPPFKLMYQGRDDRPLKEAFANLFRNCVAEETHAPRAGTPRIGLVVTNRHEGIFLRCMRGILEHIDTDSLEITVVCSRSGSDKIRGEIRNPAIGVLPVARRFDQMLEAIRAARFDLLYYWEVGSGTASYFLPMFRPAPVQCTSWGIPVTSGMPQIDFFLSSELVESEEADGHYTENLVRLSTLLSYQERATLAESAKRRADFGFTAADHLYVCGQNIGKFHPDFDPLLAAILRRDELGVLAIPGDRHGVVTDDLRRRFAATMPDVAGRVVFLPWQPYGDYLGLLSAADVLLDPLHFGGAVTTYDALSLNRPIVTLPTRFARGRYTLGCYRKMGVTACVASGPEDYVDIAVRLGTDADFRASVRRRIEETSDVLFEDVAAVRQYERIFERLVERSRRAARFPLQAETV